MPGRFTHAFLAQLNQFPLSSHKHVFFRRCERVPIIPRTPGLFLHPQASSVGEWGGGKGATLRPNLSQSTTSTPPTPEKPELLGPRPCLTITRLRPLISSRPPSDNGVSWWGVRVGVGVPGASAGQSCGRNLVSAFFLRTGYEEEATVVVTVVDISPELLSDGNHQCWKSSEVPVPACWVPSLRRSPLCDALIVPASRGGPETTITSAVLGRVNDCNCN